MGRSIFPADEIGRAQRQRPETTRPQLAAHLKAKEKPAGVTGGLAQPIPRLTADLNSSYSPAVARHDAMRNQATIASFRIVIVAAEAGGVAAPGADAARGHRGRLKQSDSRQCEHGYNCFPHRASLHCAPQEYNTFAAGLFGGRTSFAVN